MAVGKETPVPSQDKSSLRGLGGCFLSPLQSRDLGTPLQQVGARGAGCLWGTAPCLISSSVSPLQEKEAALLGGAQQHRHLAFMCNFDLKRSEEPSSVRGSQVLNAPGHLPAWGPWGVTWEHPALGLGATATPQPGHSVHCCMGLTAPDSGPGSTRMGRGFLLQASCPLDGGGPQYSPPGKGCCCALPGRG